MTSTRALSLAFLPLDERPVNIGLPAGIAAIAGATLVLPPAELLPQLRQPGDADGLGRWLERTAPSTDAVIASLDMLCYGGLIAARTTADTTLSALTRLDVLRRLHAVHPALPLCAVSLVMRASNSYNPQEEPDYWARHGMELHQLGALHHRDLLETLGASHAGNAEALVALRAALPGEIVADFERRRLRNHHVNLEAIALASEGVIDPLLITADDTAEHSAGSAEQVWLKQWSHVLPISGEVLMYPGADEVAAVLVARQLGARFGVAPRFTVECADPPGMQRIAKYENSPMHEAVDRQLRASGSVTVTDPEAMALVVHAPDPKRRDHCGMVVERSGAGHDGTQSIFDDDDAVEAKKTADLIARLLAAGREVALADLRYSNGADPLLIEELHRRGILLELVAYGGWNTAGNALGSVVAAATAIQIGRAAGTFDAAAARRVLLHRLIEDFAYMTEARRPLNAGVYSFPDRTEEVAAETAIGAGLDATLKRLTGRDDLGITAVRFPWHRSFEVDFTIAGDLS
ncbi:hypothetical protein ASC89_14285 [Devosia sp. Root413D1]|uniref:DUF4127 family protein n=1 Tax=unclassified Devosia TaxID=196773 RepID=UPI0007009C21|nr:DUF4127 family protein [Devosia sp. Root413D1]KQW77983.1 hypothetical protein ASC89_14285 [Devosia sp. Root413D1]